MSRSPRFSLASSTSTALGTPAAALPVTPSLDETLRAAARAEVEAAASRLARPVLVHQRTVERVVGLPARDYLRLARAEAFTAWKERRLVLARTADVVAYVEAHPRERGSAEDDEAYDQALARVGARRVGKRTT